MKTLYTLSLLLLLVISSHVSAQTFQKTIGGSQSDYASSVVENSDGSYIICGSSYSFASFASRIMVVKTDTNGDTLWTRLFQFGSLDYPYYMQRTSDGGYIITGTTYIDLVNYDEL